MHRSLQNVIQTESERFVRFPKSPKFDKARIQLLKDFGQGEVNALHPESSPGIGQLIRINELGLLTEDSQQGRILKGNVPIDRALFAEITKELASTFMDEEQEIVETNIRVEYTKRGGKFTRGIYLKEKAYLSGFMPLDPARKLVQLLDQMDNIVAWQVQGGTGEDSTAGSWVTYELATQEGEFSNSAELPLFGVTSLKMNDQPFSDNEYGELMGADPQDDHLFSYVSIQDSRFGSPADGKDGLFSKVILALKNL